MFRISRTIPHQAQPARHQWPLKSWKWAKNWFGVQSEMWAPAGRTRSEILPVDTQGTTLELLQVPGCELMILRVVGPPLEVSAGLVTIIIIIILSSSSYQHHHPLLSDTFSLCSLQLTEEPSATGLCQMYFSKSHKFGAGKGDSTTFPTPSGPLWSQSKNPPEVSSKRAENGKKHPPKVWEHPKSTENNLG